MDIEDAYWQINLISHRNAIRHFQDSLQHYQDMSLTMRRYGGELLPHFLRLGGYSEQAEAHIIDMGVNSFYIEVVDPVRHGAHAPIQYTHLPFEYLLKKPEEWVDLKHYLTY